MQDGHAATARQGGQSILFVHISKCGGGSVRSLLRTSPDTARRLVIDDSFIFDSPPEQQIQAYAEFTNSPETPPSGAIVYGHFHPMKYLGGAPAAAVRPKLVTILRDPLARMISHFRFFRDNTHVRHPLRTQMISESWDFERFALGPEYQNMMSRILLGVPLERFDFIGDQSCMRESLQEISRVCGLSLETSSLPQVNVATDDVDGVEITPSLRQRIRAWHAADYRLVERARRQFMPGKM